MKFEQHCERCQRLLGAPWQEVHLWLDQYAWHAALAWQAPSFRVDHRKYLHNREGIAQVRAMWGEDAAQAAIRHVLDDLYGPNENDATKIPVDQVDYVKRGFR